MTPKGKHTKQFYSWSRNYYHTLIFLVWQRMKEAVAFPDLYKINWPKNVHAWDSYKGMPGKERESTSVEQTLNSPRPTHISFQTQLFPLSKTRKNQQANIFQHILPHPNSGKTPLSYLRENLIGKLIKTQNNFTNLKCKFLRLSVTL